MEQVVENTAKVDAFWIRPASHEDVRAMARLLQELFVVETEFEFDEEKQRCALEMLLESNQSGVVNDNYKVTSTTITLTG